MKTAYPLRPISSKTVLVAGVWIAGIAVGMVGIDGVVDVDVAHAVDTRLAAVVPLPPDQVVEGQGELTVTQPASALGEIPCPKIPDAHELRLSDEERRRIDQGEIVLQFTSSGLADRQVRAIGFLDADPIWLFDLATDSPLAPELVSAVKSVEVIEQNPLGKLFRGVAKPSFVLPTYRYTLSAKYLPDLTGQCWGQLEGDFERNEGAHSFIWDPARGQTLSVFSFYFSLRGVLSLLPEEWILRSAGKTLPEFMRRLEAQVPKSARKDRKRARRNAAKWATLKPRLEAGELPGRVWPGYPPIQSVSVVR